MESKRTQHEGPEGEGNERTRLGSRLRDARTYLGFSQEEVATYLGISRSALSNVETGQRKTDALELKKLAKLYKQPVSHFTGEDEREGTSDFAGIAHLARQVQKLSPEDREELERFAAFLRTRKKTSKD